jgi:hypothetical protein
MQMRRGLAIAALLSLGACVGLSPHSDPSSITAAEIGTYRLGILKGCSDQGNSKGDDPAATKRYCDCALEVLKQSLSHDQWQQATFASQKRLDREEMGVIGPHMPQIKACKASG